VVPEVSAVLPVLPEPAPEPAVAEAPSAGPRLLRAPAEPPPPGLPEDMKFLWDVWQREKPGGRGVLERGRGARIVEGGASQGEAPAESVQQVSRVIAEPPPVSEQRVSAEESSGTSSGPRRLSRQPAESSRERPS